MYDNVQNKNIYLNKNFSSINKDKLFYNQNFIREYLLRFDN